MTLQRPGATSVAGFNAWRKMERAVRKNEKAIWILAPMVHKRRDDGQESEQQIIRGVK